MFFYFISSLEPDFYFISSLEHDFLQKNDQKMTKNAEIR